MAKDFYASMRANLEAALNIEKKAAEKKAEEARQEERQQPEEDLNPDSSDEKALLRHDLDKTKVNPQEKTEKTADECENAWRSASENCRILFRLLVSADSSFLNLTKAEIKDSRGKEMKYPTRRKCLERLVEIGAVSHHKVYCGASQGLSFTIDEKMREVFYQLFSGGRHMSATKLRRATLMETAVLESPEQTMPEVSDKKRESEAFFEKALTHPEYSFWRKIKLSAKEVAAWATEFNFEDELLDTYLKRAAFQIERDSAKGKKIDSPKGWFYTILKEKREFSAPDGYVCLEEKQLAELKEQQAKKHAIQEQYEKLLQEAAEKQLKEAFEDLMAQGDENDIYRELYQSIPPRMRSDSKLADVVKNLMYEKYKKYLGL